MDTRLSRNERFLNFLYNELNNARNYWLFKLLSWLYINLLRLIWVIFFVLGIIFLFQQQYSLAYLIFILWFLFFLLDRVFSLQRISLVKIDLNSLLKIIQNKKYSKSSFKLTNELAKDLEDYLDYDLQNEDERIKKDILYLINYIKFILSYKDYKDSINIQHLENFIKDLMEIINTQGYTQITHLLSKDFKDFKEQKDFKILQNRYSNKKINWVNVHSTLDSLTNNTGIPAHKKLAYGLTWILNLFQKNFKGVLAALLIIILILWATGKIDLTTFLALIEAIKP